MQNFTPKMIKHERKTSYNKVIRSTRVLDEYDQSGSAGLKFDI